jgi:hypothetical protein
VTTRPPAATGAPAGDVAAGLLAAPESLPVAHQDVWRLYAPPAIEAGTLTPRTAGAFALLCKLIVMEQAVVAQIEADGWTFVKITIDGAGQEHQELKSHPLCSHHRGLVQRLETQMKNFGVMPFGKPIVDRKPKGPANPWSTVVER